MELRVPVENAIFQVLRRTVGLAETVVHIVLLVLSRTVLPAILFEDAISLVLRPSVCVELGAWT